MLTIKNGAEGELLKQEGKLARSKDRFNPFHHITLPLLLVSLAMVVGCAPAGPRALLEGVRLLDQGKNAEAVEKLKNAASLLNTNARAWNYLGLAYHQTGQGAEAEKAYQRALALNHDLTEAHYNLGCLWLEQNRIEAAKTELLAYTLRRGSSVEGLLKLGAIQLRAREPMAAEKSFNDALHLSPENPQALNGLGLARVQRQRAAEGAQFFNRALKRQPDYPPALLNLAIVSQQYLKEPQVALQKYREYLALKPPPPNHEAVMVTAHQLEQELAPPPRLAATNAAIPVSPVVNTPKSPVTNLARIVASAPKPAAPATNVPKAAPAPAAAPAGNVELVKLPAAPVIKPAQDVAPPPARVESLTSETNAASNASASHIAGAPPSKSGLLQLINPLNLFHGEEKSPPGVTPLPSTGGSAQPEPGKSALTAGESATEPGVLATSARYAYKSPARPAPGNRAAAERSFNEGLRAQQGHRLAESMAAYRAATRLDPSYFEAYYSLGLTAAEAGNVDTALTAYEYALAVRTDSLDARYNFALVLKQANFLADAANELEKVLAKAPNETRAHLALGNLYAQQLHEPATARFHYEKVLDTQPRHPQADAIRYWLADNPAK